MNMAELGELRRHGIDVELHTHRHPLLLDAARLGPEITDNREVLEDALGERLQHFCYPSGVWSDALWPVLEQHGILSATTCDKGLNAADAHPYALRRYLDCEKNSQIEFEAELSGFAEVLRRLTFAKAPRRLGSRGQVPGVLSHNTVKQ
jgi:peptidoglycan/xylan/chitin deacetylase (PgdA/CDA1 family)